MLMTTAVPDEEPRPRQRRPQPVPERPVRTEPLVLTGQFTSSSKGARLARRVAVKRMEEWGWPPESDASCTVALLIGELTANAVRHGRVPGRDFRLRMTCETWTGAVRVEVSDASSERPSVVLPTSPGDESGRGLFLVDVLSDRWGVASREPAGCVGKTVWAEVVVPVRRDGPAGGVDSGAFTRSSADGERDVGCAP